MGELDGPASIFCTSNHRSPGTSLWLRELGDSRSDTVRSIRRCEPFSNMTGYRKLHTERNWKKSTTLVGLTPYSRHSDEEEMLFSTWRRRGTNNEPPSCGNITDDLVQMKSRYGWARWSHVETARPWGTNAHRDPRKRNRRNQQRALAGAECPLGLRPFSWTDLSPHNRQVVQVCCSVAKSCLTCYDPINCSTPGFPVLHHLPEFIQIHVHWVSDSLQPSHPFHPLLLHSIFIRVYSSESVLCIRWPKYWSFSISSSNEYSGLISFRMDWLDLLEVQGTLLQHHSSKHQFLGTQLSL